MNSKFTPIPLRGQILRSFGLGLSSVLLSMSVIFAIVAPLPVSLARLRYGQKISFFTSAFLMLVLAFGSVFWLRDWTIFLLFSVNTFIALIIGEVVAKGINPVPALLKSGLALFALMALATSLFFLSIHKTPTTFLTEQLVSGQELLDAQKKALEQKGNMESETLRALNLLNNPKLMAQEIVKEAPSSVFITLFLSLWLNAFVVLRSFRLMPSLYPRHYHERALLNFKMPDIFIWIVIVALALSLFGENIDAMVPVYGMTVLKVLGVFYFFQGLGIYFELLDKLKLFGLIRSILIFITLMTAARVIAVIGLFDMFFNFKKIITKILRS